MAESHFLLDNTVGKEHFKFASFSKLVTTKLEGILMVARRFGVYPMAPSGIQGVLWPTVMLMFDKTGVMSTEHCCRGSLAVDCWPLMGDGHNGARPKYGTAPN